MADPVFTIAPLPHWVVIDNFSRLPAGAAIYTYRSLDPSTFKPAFQDAAGNIPYGQPIVGFANGTFPPIFWEFDPDNPTDTYYIRVYDSANTTTQQFLWDFDGLSGGGSGGGGTVITATDLENLIVNNIFYRNIGDQLGTPSVPLFLTIAPSNNAGFVGNPASLSGGSAAPDITFQKNNATATDNLRFVDFTPLGVNALSSDVTPDLYVQYQCLGAGAGETYKYVQFPISKGQSLSQQTATIKIYAQCLAGNTTLQLYWRQFYGDGGGSAETLVPAGPAITLDNTWKAYLINSSVIPDATTKTPGACGNGGLFLQVAFPLDDVTTINFIKPAVYLGNVAPGIDFVSNDEVNSVVNSPRTGDIRTSLNSVILGWVMMNDGVISTSGVFVLPPGIPAARHNIDTFPLFSLIWNLFQANQTLAPMFTAAGAPVAYGASAIADFIAPRQLQLTKAAGRIMAGISGAHLIGTFGGAETVAITTANLPNTDGVSAIGGYVAQAAPGVFALQVAAGATLKNIVPGGVPISVVQPTVYSNIFVKL